MDIKTDLKKIIRERLENTASTIFIDKCLSLITESAENKESLLYTAGEISRRIALFIDAGLAEKIHDVLKMEIQNRKLTVGTRRKHKRFPVSAKVRLNYNGTSSEFYTVNVSAGGMYIKTRESMPLGTKIIVTCPFRTDSSLDLKAVVVNVKAETGKTPAGIGIEFKALTDHDLKRLREFVKIESAQDILEDS